MAERLLRRSGAFHDVRSPPISAPIPMRKQLTGEPVAGELHTGFGGRGRQQPFPTLSSGRLASVRLDGDLPEAERHISDANILVAGTAQRALFAKPVSLRDLVLG